MGYIEPRLFYLPFKQSKLPINKYNLSVFIRTKTINDWYKTRITQGILSIYNSQWEYMGDGPYLYDLNEGVYYGIIKKTSGGGILSDNIYVINLNTHKTINIDIPQQRYRLQAVVDDEIKSNQTDYLYYPTIEYISKDIDNAYNKISINTGSHREVDTMPLSFWKNNNLPKFKYHDFQKLNGTTTIKIYETGNYYYRLVIKINNDDMIKESLPVNTKIEDIISGKTCITRLDNELRIECAKPYLCQISYYKPLHYINIDYIKRVEGNFDNNKLYSYDAGSVLYYNLPGSYSGGSTRIVPDSPLYTGYQDSVNAIPEWFDYTIGDEYFNTIFIDGEDIGFNLNNCRYNSSNIDSIKENPGGYDNDPKFGTRIFGDLRTQKSRTQEDIRKIINSPNKNFVST